MFPRNKRTQRFDNKFYDLHLWQARNCNCADDAHIQDNQWERAAMRSILAFRDEIFLLNCLTTVFEMHANVVRAMPETAYYIDLALDPFIIIRAGSAHSIMKQLLSITRNIDGYRPDLRLSRLQQRQTHFQRRLIGKTRKLQLIF